MDKGEYTMKLGRSLELFLTAKRGELVSEKTVAYYEYWTKDFFRYAVTVQGAYDWDSIRAEHIQSYLAMLGTERKVRSATVHDAYRAVKALNRWLFKQSYIPSCVIDKVQAPKQEKIIPRTFTIKEIQAMYGACNKTSFAGVRDRTMLTLLLSSGIRKSELAGILSEDVDLEQGHIKVYGKGNKQRLLPLAHKAKKALEEYNRLKACKIFPIRSKYYFVNNKGAKLNNSSMDSIFKRIKERSGIQGAKVSCHTWRHTFAKSYLLNGGDVFSLQRLLGHSDLSTTKRYLNLNTKEIQTQYDKFNPLDNMDWVF